MNKNQYPLVQYNVRIYDYQRDRLKEMKNASQFMRDVIDIVIAEKIIVMPNKKIELARKITRIEDHVKRLENDKPYKEALKTKEKISGLLKKKESFNELLNKMDEVAEHLEAVEEAEFIVEHYDDDPMNISRNDSVFNITMYTSQGEENIELERNKYLDAVLPTSKGMGVTVNKNLVKNIETTISRLEKELNELNDKIKSIKKIDNEIAELDKMPCKEVIATYEEEINKYQCEIEKLTAELKAVIS